MAKVSEYQYTYKKKIGFTLQQKESLDILKDHGVNVNQFIRQAITEKIKREWPMIKEKHKRKIENAPDWY